MSRLRVSESEIITDIRRIARLLRHSPSSVEYTRLGRYNIRTLQRRFGLSWQQIVESAGLRYTPRTFRTIPTTEELRRDVCRVMREIDHPPTRADYEAHGRFGAETLRRRSGERKWEDAVASFTGINREMIKSHQRKGGCYRTTEEWLSRLRELSLKLGHAPTTRESNEGGINAHQLCLRVGGKWEDVLKAAGIDLRSRKKYAASRSAKTEALIEDVVVVSRRQGRSPTIREYEAHGHYSGVAVRGRIGGWRKVKKIVAERLRETKTVER